MKLSVKPFKPYTTTSNYTQRVSSTEHVTQKLQPHFSSTTLTKQVSFNSSLPAITNYKQGFLDPIKADTRLSPTLTRIGKRWMEFQGVADWAGLLDPLDDSLRAEILRYGNFVEAAYRAFDFDPSSPSYGSCKHTKKALLEEVGFPGTGYRLTKNLRATSGIQLPGWVARSSWMTMQSSWIGYVAVSHDKAEINRLGRRDVVISLRGTATCLEWLENLRATLAPITGPTSRPPMVESGFWSLYTSCTETSMSLQETIRREVGRILDLYPDEPLSFTFTGHSLGAALATLAAYDIKKTFERRAHLVTVISFGGPRVGNSSFRSLIDKQGTKILRIVNPNDLITKVPRFVIDNNNDDDNNDDVSIQMHPILVGFWSSWVQKQVEVTQWMYVEVGCELRLTSQESGRKKAHNYLNNIDLAKCHDLKTYLDLVKRRSSNCPLRSVSRSLLNKHCHHINNTTTTSTNNNQTTQATT